MPLKYPYRRPQFKLLFQSFLACLIGVLLGMTGCEKKSAQSVPEPEFQMDIPDPLGVLVVGEPDLGQRVARQWSARRDGKLTVVNQTLDEFVDSDFAVGKEIDIVIYPPALMGELVQRQRLRAMPNDILNSDEYNKHELLRHFRTSVARQNDESWGVPLGGPNFAMLYQRKLFQSIKPVETWEQLERTLAKIEALPADVKGDLPAKVDMPLAKGWAVQTLLARVAPAICYRGKLSTVFDRRTMTPLVNEAPFVEALNQIQDVSTERSRELDPRGVFQLAASGQSSIAMSWPAFGFNLDSDTDESKGDDPSRSANPDSLMIRSLPGLENWYDHQAKSWKRRGDEDAGRVELVGFSGLVASVSANCAHDRSAWEFLQWLPSKTISKVVLIESPILGPFRASHLGDTGLWTGGVISVDVADEFGDVIAANHERTLSLMFPRIPGYQRYLDALDEAVRSTVAGEQTAQAALDSAAKQWDEITESIGRDKQIDDLRKETGL